MSKFSDTGLRTSMQGSMTPEKRFSITPGKKEPTSGTQPFKGDNLMASSTQSKVYALSIKNPVAPETPTIGLSLNLTEMMANERKIFLDFDCAYSLILNYGSFDFPTRIHILCPQLDGRLDNSGSPTHILATLIARVDNVSYQTGDVPRLTIRY